MKKQKVFKSSIELLKLLLKELKENKLCDNVVIHTVYGCGINSQGDNELDGSFEITITGNKTK